MMSGQGVSITWSFGHGPPNEVKESEIRQQGCSKKC